ncbi:MAG: vWA domain-containing protein [Verrucomicrobiota bacterium]|jgi:Ca-activated chloride channel homolog
MSFAHPWVLLFLILPVLLGYWEWTRRGHRLVLPFDHGPVRHGRILERLVKSANLMAALLLATAILLLAGPQRLYIPDKERVLTNIQFVLDVSGSMTSPFGEGSRYDAAMKAIQEFTKRRKGDAFGLTIFGNEVLHWVPLTKDTSAINLSTPFLRPEKQPPWMGGTQIAKALREVRKVLATRPEGDRMIILVSDGVSSDLFGGQAEEIGNELGSDRIVVYYVHAADGSPQPECHAIATATGGTAFAASDPAGLDDVFQHIDKMQPTKLKPGAPEFADWFWPFVAIGLVAVTLQCVTQFGLRFTPW